MKDDTLTRTIFTMQWFFEAGATPFVRAAQSGDVELMKLLLGSRGRSEAGHRLRRHGALCRRRNRLGRRRDLRAFTRGERGSGEGCSWTSGWTSILRTATAERP